MTSSLSETMADTTLDDLSDYGDFGSDAEEIAIINELLEAVEQKSPQELPTVDPYVDGLLVADIEDGPEVAIVPLSPRVASRYRQYEGLEAVCDGSESAEKKRATPEERVLEPVKEPSAEPDDRSPLERFRKPPKKALSVTDLVSPAWCELQYYYVLSKHGRKRRTPAMKQGSAVHKKLEEEIHVAVPVETVSKEDSWALRIWNVCQGLKSLRENGKTRELEIWGTVGGELVNGIIDELSYECPDPAYEESLKAKGVPAAQMPEYQTSITEYLLAKPQSKGLHGKGREQQNDKWVYITDVKTRATPTLPTGTSLRPVLAQLHLYHHLLENLIQGNFSLDVLVDRYDLDPHGVFSDSFIAQIGGLDYDEPFDSACSDDTCPSTLPLSQDPVSILTRNNNLTDLWQYMISQFQTTFLLDPVEQPGATFEPPASQQSTSDLPPPPSQPTRLAPLLSAVYLSAPPRRPSNPEKVTPPKLLGRKSFQFNPAFLHKYLSDTLPWWRGEREAAGVALEEAWKCRSCDFKTDCSWIHDRNEQAFKAALERKKMREMAGLENADAPRSEV